MESRGSRVEQYGAVEEWRDACAELTRPGWILFTRRPEFEGAAIAFAPLLTQVDNEVVAPLKPCRWMQRIVEVQVELAARHMRVEPPPMAVWISLQQLCVCITRQ